MSQPVETGRSWNCPNCRASGNNVTTETDIEFASLSHVVCAECGTNVWISTDNPVNVKTRITALARERKDEIKAEALVGSTAILDGID